MYEIGDDTCGVRDRTCASELQWYISGSRNAIQASTAF